MLLRRVAPVACFASLVLALGVATQAQAPAAAATATGEAPPRWRTMNAIEMRASQPGVVESLAVTNGGWVDASNSPVRPAFSTGKRRT